jgi:hypothetical protein
MMNLRTMKVALSEKATLVTDDAELQKLVNLLDGESVASAKFFRPFQGLN